MKVGQLAAKTGLTVRTLHHYDEIGLLSPSGRTPTGHRIYGEAEVRRLQQIASLRHLGLSLEEVRECLDDPAMSLEHALELQIRRIDEEIEQRRRLRDLVQDLRRRLSSNGAVTVDDLARTIEGTVNYERYYSPDQLDRLAVRREELGPDRIAAAEEEWQQLFAAFGDAMTRGVPADSEEVRTLARRSAALIDEFTGGDAEIVTSLTNMYRDEGGENVMERHGAALQPGLWEYMGKARAALEADS